jgi:hypothetical protein
MYKNLLKLKDKENNINKLKKKFKVRSKDKLSALWKELKNPQAHMPNEGIFDIPVSTFFTSNKDSLPF